ncbi:putative reverse transcriptase domain-containing protein [Tanacetum coccineum]
MVTTPTDGKVSFRSLPLYERCFTRHVGHCTIKCHKCGKVGHKARYCKEKNVATSENALPILTCYDCGEQVKDNDTGFMIFHELFLRSCQATTDRRKVEFRIDLVPGATPVARAPYRLAPSEMRELSVQLQELLEKGFTSLSLSRVEHRMFIDDILVYSKDEEEHGKHLKIILELLKKKRLHVKFSKCDFWLDSVQFLGHVIDHSGVHVVPAKFEALEFGLHQTDGTEVGAISWIDGYYRVYELWSRVCKERKGCRDIRFLLVWDRFYSRLTCVVVAYASRQWESSRRELHYSRLGVGAAVSPLKELNLRQWRWIELLSDYDYEIRYHPRKANVMADALSRIERNKPLRVRASMMTVHNDLPKQIREA